MCHKKTKMCVSFLTAGTAITNSFSGSNQIPLLKLNASTHIKPLQDNKVSTGESLTSFTLFHLPSPLRVNTKLPSTPQGFFFTSSTNTSIFFSLFFFQTYIWHGKKCELSVYANFLCLEGLRVGGGILKLAHQAC